MLYQMNSEVFNARTTSRPSSITGMYPAVEVFHQPDTKTLIVDMALHAADVSNPCRAWEVTQAWALVCLDEFAAQGDEEKKLGIPVQFLNDREKLNRPNSQIGFIEFMIAPFFSPIIQIWPSLRELGDNLAHNIRCWEDLWIQEASPAEEEQQKVRARVVKVEECMANCVRQTSHSHQ